MRRYLTIAAAIVIWELLPRLGLVKPFLLPPFTTVIAEGVAMLIKGQLTGDIAVTLGRAAIGLAAAIVVGISIGLAMALHRPTREALKPLTSFLYPTPKIGFYPLLIILLGIGHLSKVGLVFVEAIFPVILATFAAATRVNPKLLWSAQALGTGPRALITRIFLPASLPEILTGCRIAAIVALITVFTAEMVSSAEGLGHLMMRSARTFEIPQMYVALVLISLIGAVLDWLLLRLRRWLLVWHAEADLH